MHVLCTLKITLWPDIFLLAFFPTFFLANVTQFIYFLLSFGFFHNFLFIQIWVLIWFYCVGHLWRYFVLIWSSRKFSCSKFQNCISLMSKCIQLFSQKSIWQKIVFIKHKNRKSYEKFNNLLFTSLSQNNSKK